MSIKLLHISDVHLEVKLDFLGKKAVEHRGQILTSFVKVVETAIAGKFQIVVIAGDLFDSPYPGKVVQMKVLEQFKKLEENGIYVAVIAGNHDNFSPNSVFLEKNFSEFGQYVKVFKPGEIIWEIKDLDVTLYGISLQEGDENTKLVSKIATNRKNTKYAVAILHGSMNINEETLNTLKVEELKNLRVNYIALGDWHSTKQISDNPQIWYSGSPELINVNQIGSGNYLEVLVDDVTMVNTKPIGSKSAKRLEIDISGIRTLHDLKDLILRSVAEDKSKVFANIYLVGTKSLDLKFSLEELTEVLSPEFYYLKIKDKSNIELTQGELNSFPEDSLLGRYLRLLNQKKGEDYAHNRIIDDAIQIGVGLLKKR